MAEAAVVVLLCLSATIIYGQEFCGQGPTEHSGQFAGRWNVQMVKETGDYACNGVIIPEPVKNTGTTRRIVTHTGCVEQNRVMRIYTNDPQQNSRAIYTVKNKYAKIGGYLAVVSVNQDIHFNDLVHPICIPVSSWQVEGPGKTPIAGQLQPFGQQGPSGYGYGQQSTQQPPGYGYSHPQAPQPYTAYSPAPSAPPYSQGPAGYAPTGVDPYAGYAQPGQGYGAAGHMPTHHAGFSALKPYGDRPPQPADPFATLKPSSSNPFATLVPHQGIPPPPQGFLQEQAVWKDDYATSCGANLDKDQFCVTGAYSAVAQGAPFYRQHQDYDQTYRYYLAGVFSHVQGHGLVYQRVLPFEDKIVKARFGA